MRDFILLLLLFACTLRDSLIVPACLQAVPDIQDRQHANTRATARACVELSQRHRSADAAKLEQLVQEWLRYALDASQKQHVEPQHPIMQTPGCA